MDTRQKKTLEVLYHKYNKRRFVHPDPLEYVYGYPEKADREIVGIIASALAYGQVARILKSVSAVLTVMGTSPHDFLIQTGDADLHAHFNGFRHRFADAGHIVSFLIGIRHILHKFGSLNHCFLQGLTSGKKDLHAAMIYFADALKGAEGTPGHLVADPRKGSACKRMNLFLRWMVRHDDVDPGGWTGIDMSQLIVPIDTHMHKIALGLGLTTRKQANMRTALEITDGFKKISPNDPVKYDFALTRFGIRSDMTIEALLCKKT